MLEWIIRGLGRGIVTTRYPARPEPASPSFRGRIAVIDGDGAEPEIAGLCPTGAIVVDDGHVRVDRARCILCGLCVEHAPTRFAFESVHETGARRRQALWVNGRAPTDDAPLSPSLGDQARALRRSIHIRHVDAGSDGSEEWEIAALTNPYYDMQRLGLYFTASPRHADVLLVTGVVTESMRLPLLRAYEVMPEPKAVVAAGTDACSGGITLIGDAGSGVDAVLPVDVYVPGSPPTPIALLHGLLLAAGIVSENAAA